MQEVTLNEDQRKALDHISRQIETGRFGVTLLHGVTDSGKTELYIRAIEQVVRQGQGGDCAAAGDCADGPDGAAVQRPV